MEQTPESNSNASSFSVFLCPDGRQTLENDMTFFTQIKLPLILLPKKPHSEQRFPTL